MEARRRRGQDRPQRPHDPAAIAGQNRDGNEGPI